MFGLAEEFEIYVKETGLHYLEKKGKEYMMIRKSFYMGVFKSLSIFMDEVPKEKTVIEYLSGCVDYLEEEAKLT